MTSTGTYFIVAGQNIVHLSLDLAVLWANKNLPIGTHFDIITIGMVYSGEVWETSPINQKETPQQPNEEKTVTTLPCGCETYPRPALEHPGLGCPARLQFYGAPLEWGAGHPGEVRFDSGHFFVWNSGQRTWVQIRIYSTAIDFPVEIRC